MSFTKIKANLAYTSRPWKGIYVLVPITFTNIKPIQFDLNQVNRNQTPQFYPVCVMMLSYV